MISEIPVGLTDLYFVDAAEGFQKETKSDGEGAYVETGELATSYDGTAYLIDVQVGTFVHERGLRAWAGQAITVEVPIEGATEALKQIRAMPPQTPIRFVSLTARPGVSAKNRLYVIWTGKGVEAVRSVRQSPVSAPAQAQG